MDRTEYDWFTVEAEVTSYEADASFSHDLGVRKEVDLVIDYIDILSATDEDGGDVALNQDMIDLVEDRVAEYVTKNWRDGNLTNK